METPQGKLRIRLEELGRHRHKALVTLARARGIPNPADGLEEVLKSEVGVPDMKAIALTALIEEMQDGEVSESREAVFTDIQTNLKRVKLFLALDVVGKRLHELSRRFKLLPATYEHRLLQRLVKGEFSRKRSFGSGAYSEQWHIGFAQAVNLRDALTYLVSRLERPQTEPPKVYAQVQGVLAERFARTRPISRVTTQLAAQGVITSDATLLALRAGKYRSGDGYRIRESKAALILEALKRVEAA